MRELQNCKCELFIPAVHTRGDLKRIKAVEPVEWHFVFAEEEAMIISITFAFYSDHKTYLDDLGIIASE